MKFLSNFTFGDGRGAKTITLQGSTAGTGEIAGVIPNATGSTLILNITKSGVGAWTLSAANYISVLRRLTVERWLSTVR